MKLTGKAHNRLFLSSVEKKGCLKCINLQIMKFDGLVISHIADNSPHRSIFYTVLFYYCFLLVLFDADFFLLVSTIETSSGLFYTGLYYYSRTSGIGACRKQEKCLMPRL